MKILWLTDIHLNFVSTNDIEDLCRQVLAYQPDMVLLAGDIAEAPTVGSYLTLLEQQLQCPIYFVLGNHDFYKGSIAEVKTAMAELTADSPWLNYLPQSGIIKLTDSSCLIGHDSWADGRNGDYERSGVMLNDYMLITELAGMSKAERLAKLNALGDEAAAYLTENLLEAFKTYQQVFMVMHVPPFREAAWHEGHESDEDFAPHFSCKAVGDGLLKVMSQHPDRFLTVLCGHTHSPGLCQKLPNFQVKTGEALYREPQIQDPIWLE